jgi:hypothetical protein
LILRAIAVVKRCQQWALSVNKSFTTTRAEMIHPSATGSNRRAQDCERAAAKAGRTQRCCRRAEDRRYIERSAGWTVLWFYPTIGGAIAAGRDVTNEVFPDLAFEAEFVDCNFQKVAVARNSERNRVVTLFGNYGIKHTIGSVRVLFGFGISGASLLVVRFEPKWMILPAVSQRSR